MQCRSKEDYLEIDFVNIKGENTDLERPAPQH
jgi:hypothetical protein